MLYTSLSLSLSHTHTHTHTHKHVILTRILEKYKVWDILTIERKHQNVEVDNNAMGSDLTHDLEDCIVSHYGRHLVHMLIAQTKQL